MKFNKLFLIPVGIIVFGIIFFPKAADNKTQNTNLESKNISLSSTLAPTTHVLGIETKKDEKNTVEDTSICELITTAIELKEITGNNFKKVNSEASDGKTLDCKYTYNNQVVNFYLIHDSVSNFNNIKETSKDIQNIEGLGQDAFYVKTENTETVYILDNEKLMAGSMTNISNNFDIKEKLIELTSRMLTRD